jgi:ABC-2 type transport system permease protein
MEKKKLFKGFYNWTFLIVLVAIVIVANIIASYLYVRFDATADGRYSISNGTKEYLKNDKNFENRLSIKIYLEGNLPSELKRFRNAVEDKLKEFKLYAGARIEYTFIDPMEGTEEDQQYLFETLYNKGKGIMPMDLMFMKDGAQNQMMLWPGAEIDYEGSTVNYVQLLPGTPQGKFYTLNEQFEQQIQNSINNLEYMLISAIRRVTQSEKPRVAFLQGHGELTYAQTQRVRMLIAPYYTVEDITLNDSINALDGVKGLIIARPTKPFSDKDKYLIDQFVMKGGRLMCFLDKLQVPEDTLNAKGVTHTSRYTLEIDKMLYDYGIKINDNLVFDVNCAPKAVPMAKQSLIPWFFHVRSTQTPHPIARNLDPVLLKYASEIQFVGNNSNISSPILTSSTNSAMTGLAPMISLAIPLNYGKNPKLATDIEDENNKLCLAGLVEGEFQSHFKNRIVEAFINNPAIKFKEKSTKEGKVLVVGNGRFIENRYDSIYDKTRNDYMYRPLPFNELKMDETMASLGMQPLIYGNQEFFQNIVDYMLGDNSVLDLRSKQIDIRELDKEKVKEQAGYYKTINMILPSLFILLFALLMLYIRKRKYTRN